MDNSFQYLERLYLPGYMTLVSEDYDGNTGVFGIQPKEPQVTVFSSRYLTPRGSHISISQAGVCLVEQLMRQCVLDFDITDFRDFTSEGRLKLIELNQRFKRELRLDAPIEGRFTLTHFRPGKIPVLKMDFDLGNRSFVGNLTGVIAPKPIPQMNADVLRNPN